MNIEITNIANNIDYKIFDPTGNITALVETVVETDQQAKISAEIMRMHPEVEQVGFVSFDSDGSEDSRDKEQAAHVRLRMAGGEFCGNATMSAAALFLIRRAAGENNESMGTVLFDSSDISASDISGAGETVYVRASGVSEAVRVELRRRADAEYEAAVLMPPALSIENNLMKLSFMGQPASDRGAAGQMSETLVPIVHMPGIDHIVVTQDSALYGLSSRRDSAADVIREICKGTGSECLGMMFLREDNGKSTVKYELKPLVYVPGVDTVFWENSCASGTAAVGMYLAARDGRKTDISVAEPAGTMRVTSDPETGETWLSGTTKMIR